MILVQVCRRSPRHALLSNSRWQGADLDKLADEELAPYRSAHVDRISIFGPKITLEPSAGTVCFATELWPGC